MFGKVETPQKLHCTTRRQRRHRTLFVEIRQVIHQEFHGSGPKDSKSSPGDHIARRRRCCCHELECPEIKHQQPPSQSTCTRSAAGYY
eukprot:2335347-Rhodomonas_salina.1